MAYTSFPADAVVSGTPVSTTKFGNIAKANLDDHESRLATVETRTTDASTGNTQLGTRMTAVESGKVATSRTLTAGTGLTGGGDLSANRTFAVSYGTTSGTAVQGNDTRVTITQDATKGNNALDTRVSALESAPGSVTGPVAEVTINANSATASGTGKVIWADTGGIALVSGAKYRVSFDTGYDVSAVSTAVFELWLVPGSTATLTGASRFWRRLTRATASGSYLNTNGLARLTAPGTGTYTVFAVVSNADAGVSTKTNGGTPNSTDNVGFLTVDRVS